MLHSSARRSFETKLLALLKQACSDHEFDVADHLLRALECLAGEADAHPHGELELSCLDEGYLIIAEEIGPETSVKPCDRPEMRKKHQH